MEGSKCVREVGFVIEFLTYLRSMLSAGHPELVSDRGDGGFPLFPASYGGFSKVATGEKGTLFFFRELLQTE